MKYHVSLNNRKRILNMNKKLKDWILTIASFVLVVIVCSVLLFFIIWGLLSAFKQYKPTDKSYMPLYEKSTE